MSEVTETKVKPEVEETPEKKAAREAAVAESAEMVEKLKGYSLEELCVLSSETKLGDFSADPAVTNEAWLRRRLSYHLQAQIFERHGLKESPKIKERKVKVEAGPSSEDKPASKAGRKRMNKTGNFVLNLGLDGNTGRGNSTRSRILIYLMNLGRPFTVEDFGVAVREAMQYNETQKSFGIDTKFITIETAANAWFSELVNKSKVIVREEEPAPSASGQTATPAPTV